MQSPLDITWTESSVLSPGDNCTTAFSLLDLTYIVMLRDLQSAAVVADVFVVGILVGGVVAVVVGLAIVVKVIPVVVGVVVTVVLDLFVVRAGKESSLASDTVAIKKKILNMNYSHDGIHIPVISRICKSIYSVSTVNLNNCSPTIFSDSVML
mgnify:CR=1 FL=1